MRRTWILLIAIVLLTCGLATAQVGAGGLDSASPANIPGAGDNTWTGTLKGFDQANHTITLVRDHKGKEETFTGVVGSGVKFLDSKGKPEDGRNLTVGEKLRVYYQEMRPKDGGDKENVISRIDLMDTKK